MAQKKKAPVGPKSAAKPTVRKAVPLKVAASAQKSAKQTVKSNLEVAPKPSLAKAKVAQPAAAVKSLKKPPHPAAKGTYRRASADHPRSKAYRHGGQDVVEIVVSRRLGSKEKWISRRSAPVYYRVNGRCMFYHIEDHDGLIKVIANLEVYKA